MLRRHEPARDLYPLTSLSPSLGKDFSKSSLFKCKELETASGMDTMAELLAFYNPCMPHPADLSLKAVSAPSVTRTMHWLYSECLIAPFQLSIVWHWHQPFRRPFSHPPPSYRISYIWGWGQGVKGIGESRGMLRNTCRLTSHCYKLNHEECILGFSMGRLPQKKTRGGKTHSLFII